VVAVAASVRIGAAVLPGLPLLALHDLQGFAGLVQPRPFQPECLSLTEPESKSNDEPDSITFAQCQRQEALDLLGLEWVYFCLLDSRWLGQSDGIPGNITALERLPEGSPGSAVYLVRSARLEPTCHHPRIQLLEMLRLNAVDPMSAQTGDQMPVHGSAITDVYNSIYWFDDDMLVNTHAYGVPAHFAPVVHLRHLSSGTLFQTYARSFDLVWDQTRKTWSGREVIQNG
jgi:hypothetical protein